ncbi:MAG: hypothetical protein WCK77_25955 [Verrucomicrobiota bacterium]
MKKKQRTSASRSATPCSISSSSGWTVDLGVLDDGMRDTVEILVNGGVETFESCQGGPGHCFLEPTVRFYGGPAAGFKALAVAMDNGLKVRALRRYWTMIGEEPTGPYWEMTFLPDKAL